MSEKRYSYKPKMLKLVIFSLILGLAALKFAHMGVTNTEPLDMDGFELSPAWADVFYYCFAIICGLFTVAFLKAMQQRFANPDSYLVIEENYFICPPQIFHPERKVFFRDITKIQKKVEKSRVSYWIDTPNFKLLILEVNFQSREEFEEAIALIRSKSGK